jgi:hypothetical protein
MIRVRKWQFLNHFFLLGGYLVDGAPNNQQGLLCDQMQWAYHSARGHTPDYSTVQGTARRAEHWGRVSQGHRLFLISSLGCEDVWATSLLSSLTRTWKFTQGEQSWDAYFPMWITRPHYTRVGPRTRTRPQVVCVFDDLGQLIKRKDDCMGW